MHWAIENFRKKKYSNLPSGKLIFHNFSCSEEINFLLKIKFVLEKSMAGYYKETSN